MKDVVVVFTQQGVVEPSMTSEATIVTVDLTKAKNGICPICDTVLPNVYTGHPERSPTRQCGQCGYNWGIQHNAASVERAAKQYYLSQYSKLRVTRMMQGNEIHLRYADADIILSISEDDQLILEMFTDKRITTSTEINHIRDSVVTRFFADNLV